MLKSNILKKTSTCLTLLPASCGLLSSYQVEAVTPQQKQVIYNYLKEIKDTTADIRYKVPLVKDLLKLIRYNLQYKKNTDSFLKNKSKEYVSFVESFLKKYPGYESEFFVPSELKQENSDFLVLKENSKVFKDYEKIGGVVLSATYTVPKTFLKLFDYIDDQDILKKGSNPSIDDEFLTKIGAKRFLSANWGEIGSYFEKDIDRVEHCDVFLKQFDDDLPSTIEKIIAECERYDALDDFFSNYEDKRFNNMLEELKRINEMPNK